jgi:hypothetical protein
MAGTRIQAVEKPIGEIFSDGYRFSIPRYQRPYAWTKDEAGEMLDDLLAAARCEHRLEDSDPYFLGSVVLVKAEGDPRAEVVDGQQRLTTLTTLLSVIRAFVPAGFSRSLGQMLFQEGNPILDTLDQPRLQLRDRDQPFFEKSILDLDGVRQLDSVAPGPLTDSQRRLRENARLFQSRLTTLSEDELTRLVSYIARYTFLVVVATQDFESAYRIFTVLNERGLDLTHSDILKAEIIGAIPDEAQDAFTAVWEHEEEDLGREGFAELFSHIRMVYAKTKARESILREFRSSVLSRYPDRRTFINQALVPLSDAYEVVVHRQYQAEEKDDPRAGEINELLAWLNQLDNTDWVPPAISYLSRHGADPDSVLSFLTGLDRLAASMHLRRTDITRRLERYGRVLEAIERGTDLDAVDSPLQLSDDERAETRSALDAPIYTVTRIRLYVLLRLDSALSSGGASYDHPTITVEHVLPQNPKPGGQWRTWFDGDQRNYWVHRLANLLLLTRRKNSGAGNLEFEEKKQGYFGGHGGVSPFVLTTQVLNESTWTPEVLAVRQETLVAKLIDLGRL